MWSLTYVWCEAEVPYLFHGVTAVDTEVNICEIVQDKELQTRNTECSDIISIDRIPLCVKTKEKIIDFW
jgi:hypothetical protein